MWSGVQEWGGARECEWVGIKNGQWESQTWGGVQECGGGIPLGLDKLRMGWGSKNLSRTSLWIEN